MFSNISILIPVYNEEHDLSACLDSVSFSDDIVVYDSYSTDHTSDIARSAGARVIQRPGQDLSAPFGGDESMHRTWGIKSIKYKNPWLFVLDADERLTARSVCELLSVVASSSDDVVAYRIRRRDFFLGRHLQHVQASSWYIRLFRPEFVHYERLINPITVVNGKIGQLRYPLDHFPFSKGIRHWFDRHNFYSDFEAKEILLNQSNDQPLRFLSCFFEADPNLRRNHQKQLFYRLPARPILKFFLLYFLKRGFMDGSPGFVYALLQSIYEFMIVLKVSELRIDRS